VGGLSPSKREGSGRIKLENRLRLSSSDSMRFGTVMHAWLERIEWLDDFSIETEDLQRIARLNGMNAAQTELAVVAFSEVINRSEIRELLRRSDYLGSDRLQSLGISDANVEVRNEQSIAAKLEDGIVSGFIDRLVVFTDSKGVPIAADIIDFKTDAINKTQGNKIENKVAHYRPQLIAYKEAIKNMLRLPLNKIKSTLVFVGKGEVVDVL
jgi:ATP-dependent exoDNAse (exonuclease V) beta subunit